MSDPASAPTLPIGAPGEEEHAATYGRFVARGILGRGGMGVVVRAYDPELDREVALKLLQRGEWEASLGAPDVRAEAQALAKLAHPNVVAVYEIGQVGDAAFIAMELVEGQTLRRWLETPRPLRAVVQTFVACGRGLAAAHAAGLVHRDFKPDNVLIGADGRPRVTDFGLVTRGAAADGTVDEDGAGGEGMVAGTPPYMAPEQWRGAAVDARTDQFAFCVALWEALAGSHPFGGGPGRGGDEARRAAVLAGEVIAPKRALPRPIEAALRRGLAVERGARWPTMDALLARLERAIQRPRGWWIAPVVVAGLALGGGVWLVRVGAPAERGDACAAAAARIDEAWSPARRAQVERRLQRAGGDGEATPAAVIAALDGYAARWRAGMGDACRGAAAHGPTLRDNQTACFERARLELAAVTGALAEAGTRSAAATAGVTTRLPDVAACSDVERLAIVAAPPADPALRRRLDGVREQLAAAVGMYARGDATAALVAVQTAVDEARAVGHAPTLADGLQLQGELYMDRGDLAAAESAFRASASAGADGRDDAAVAYAWTRVVFVAAERREDLAGAQALLPVADTALRRAGDPRDLRHMFENAAGTLAARRGDFAEARARFDASMRTAGNALERAQAASNLGNVIWQTEGPAAALPTLRTALAGTQEARGAGHPDTADALYRLGACANAAGQASEARPLLERALAIQVRAWGEQNLEVALTLEALGNVASNLGDPAAAVAYLDRALAAEKAVGAPAAAIATTTAARTLALIGHDAEAARAAFPETLRLIAASSGTGTLEYGMVRATQAEVLQQLGRCDEARPIFAELKSHREAQVTAYVAQVAPRCARGR